MNLSRHSNLGTSSHHGNKSLDVSKHSSLGSSSHHAREANPIKSDGELQLLVGKVDKIQKYKTFQRWKGKFLSRFETFLYEKGIDPAEKSATEFDHHLTKVVKKTEKVLEYIHKGDLGPDKKTVKASLALNEMCNQLEQIRQEIENVVPSLKSDERTRGYSKFHLGAALIQQGFHQYLSMKLVEDHVKEIGTSLAEVADKQQHELFYSYQTQVSRFCDVMADLDMYNIMLKCVQFYNPPDESESEEALPIVIIIQLLETPHIRFEDGGSGSNPTSNATNHDDDDDDDGDEMELDDIVVVEKQMNIEVEENGSVENVKNSISTAFDVPVERQVVKFQNLILDDTSKNIEELGIRESSILTVQRVLFPIVVRDTSGKETKEIKLRVDPDTYLSNLKRSLESTTNIPAPVQNLYLQPDDILLDGVTKTLESCGLVPGAVVSLEPKSITVQVETQNDGGRHELTISPREDTTQTIKEKIEVITGLQTHRQIVSKDGQDLPSLTDESKGPAPSAKDMNILDGDVLSVDIHKIPVTVNNWNGKSIDLMVEPSSTVLDLKSQLEGPSGIPANNQALRKGGQEIHETDPKKATLTDNGIQAGDVLDLEPKCIKIQVESPDGEVHDVELVPSDTTESIQGKIEEMMGIAIPRQVVSIDGKKLPPNKTVKDMGITDGELINVDIHKIPVTVSLWDGNTMNLMVDPTESLLETKQLIDLLSPDSGLKPSNQLLSFQNKTMEDDSKSLQAYQVEPEAVINLEPKKILVNVETPTGSVHQISVVLSDQTPEIKQKAEIKTQIAVKRQIMKYQGVELPPEGKTVRDIGLRHNSLLTIEIYKINITVETWDGKSIDLMVDPTEPLIETKQQFEQDSGIPSSNQSLLFENRLLEDDSKPLDAYGVSNGSVLVLEPKAVKTNVKMPNGEMHCVILSPSDDCNAIKEKIEAATGMKVPSQVVKYNGGEILPDQTVRSLQIREDAVLDVEVLKIPVVVDTWDGKEIDLTIDPMEPLSKLKEMLESPSEIPLSNQDLHFNGQRLEDDNATLNESGVTPNSRLYLEPKIVTVQVTAPDGCKHTVGLTPYDDLSAIKAKIESATNVASRRQVVKFNEEELQADGQTVKELGIREGSELLVGILKVPVKVFQTMDENSSFTVLVDPTESLAHLKTLIEPKAGIDVENQVLSRNGNVLTDDHKLLDEYEIGKDSVVDLEPKTIIVNIQSADGRLQQVSLAPSASSNDVKVEVEASTGIEVDRQVLSFDDRILPENGSSIKDMGVRDGSTIQVSILTIPLTVNTWEDKSFEVLIDPTKPLMALKDEIEKATSLLANNQVLIHDEKQLTDNDRSIKECGVKPKDVVYVEPAVIKVKVETPDGKFHEVPIALADDCKAIKMKIADATGLAMSRQVLKKDGSYMPTGQPAKEMGIVEGSQLQVEILRFPILVNTPDEAQIKIMVEPCETLSEMKDILHANTGIKPKLQVLSKGSAEIVGETKTVIDLGLQPGSVVDLKRKDDFIVIVDVKYGTLFGADRDFVLSLGVLTPKDEHNTMDFLEATSDSREKDQMRKSMLESPNLGVKPRIVIEKMDVEDYDLEEAEAVKSKWGVQLKKPQKNKRGSELLFVDIKHGTFGFLDRRKLEEMKFITPVGQGKDATLEEAEKDAQKYDNFVKEIRNIFGVASL